jgi:serine/threonine protein kinase
LTLTLAAPADSFQDAEACYIVLEMLTGGDLYARVEPNGPGLSKSEAKQWIFQLCVATQAVHAVGYVHADIKPENCILDADNNLTLADFGLSVRNGYCHFCNVPGTEAYMSPELLGRGKKGTIITTAVDVYAVGMTWYAMLFADLPWDVAASRDAEFRAFAATGRLPGPAKAIGMLSPELYELLAHMLAPVPTDRPTMVEVLRFLSTNQPWFVTKKKATGVSASTVGSPSATLASPPSAVPRAEAAAASAMTVPAPAFALHALPSPSTPGPVPASPAAFKDVATLVTAIPTPELSRARRASHIH